MKHLLLPPRATMKHYARMVNCLGMGVFILEFHVTNLTIEAGPTMCPKIHRYRRCTYVLTSSTRCYQVYARKYKVERTFSEKVVQQAFRQFLNIFWDFWIQNCGQDGNLLNCARAHRYRREIYRSNAGEREMHLCREHAIRQSCNIIFANFFLYLYLFCKNYLKTF